MDCRIELNIKELESTEAIQAHVPGERSVDLWTEATWRDVAQLVIEGSRDFCARVSSWALEEHKGDGEHYEGDERCTCEMCR